MGGGPSEVDNPHFQRRGRIDGVHARAPRRFCALILAGALSLAGCFGGQTVVQTPARLEVVGTITGERTDDTECLWLIDSGAFTWHLVPPAGWTVTYDPVRLHDASGHQVAAEGDRVRVSGPAGYGETDCSDLPPLVADELVVINEPESQPPR